MNMPEPAAGRDVDHLAETADQVAAAMLDRTLPKVEWTHEAHVLVCISLVRRHGDIDALHVLRSAIPAYNEATGVANTATGGYHDTITAYYVWAVQRLVADGEDTASILAHRTTSRTALFEYWDRDSLMSPLARRGWLEPTVSAAGTVAPTESVQPDLFST